MAKKADKKVVGEDINLRDIVGGDVEMSVASDPQPFDLKNAVSTGLDALDVILGGGLFLARTYMISAPEGGGKSTLVDTMMTSWQKQTGGGLVVRVEQESTWDKQRAQQIGVNLDRVYVIPSATFEENTKRLSITIKKIREKLADTPVLIVWDTITAAPTDKVYEKFDDPDKEGKGPGQSEQTRLIREFLDQITLQLTNSKMTLVMVCQTYLDRSLYGKYGAEEGYIIKGGMGPAHYSSATLFLMQGKALEDSDGVTTGHKIRINIAKNKQSAFCHPNKLHAIMHSDSGFSNEETLFENLTEWNLISVKGGGWVEYSLNGKEMKFRTTDVARHMAEYPESKDYFVYLWARFWTGKFPNLAERYKDKMVAWEEKYGDKKPVLPKPE